jgi:hypothetical protein
MPPKGGIFVYVGNKSHFGKTKKHRY